MSEVLPPTYSRPLREDLRCPTPSRGRFTRLDLLGLVLCWGLMEEGDNLCSHCYRAHAEHGPRPELTPAAELLEQANRARYEHAQRVNAALGLRRGPYVPRRRVPDGSTP